MGQSLARGRGQVWKDLRIHEQIKGYLEEAGFEHVTEHVFKWPIGPWSKDPHMEEIGLWNQVHWQEGIEGWSLALLTRVLMYVSATSTFYIPETDRGLVVVLYRRTGFLRRCEQHCEIAEFMPIMLCEFV